MGSALVPAGLLDNRVGPGLDGRLGVLAAGRPGTDTEVGLLSNLEVGHPSNLEADLLDTVAVADPGNTHGSGLHVDREDLCGTVDPDTQKDVVAETLHGSLPLVYEQLVLRRNRSVLVHSD